MATLDDAALLEVLAFTESLAREAGELILQGSKDVAESGEVDEKINAVDLVTEWDLKVEQTVQSRIQAKYPDFGFIGEESYSSGRKPALTDVPTYCVDPIDGTTNFVHGFPFACISLGLLYQKQPTIGVIYNPFLDEMYTGLKGHGSFLITRGHKTMLPLRAPRPLQGLSQALIGVEWGSDRRADVMGRKSRSFVRLTGDGKPGEVEGGKMVHSMRSIGSAALNYAYVASGSLDLYWEIGCWPWDVCAGIVIAQEAGGFVSGSKSSPHDGTIPEDLLNGRKYIVVRAIAASTPEESREKQVALVQEFYDAVEEWDAL